MGSAGTGVSVGCELPEAGAGSQALPSAGAVRSHNQTHSLAPAVNS